MNRRAVLLLAIVALLAVFVGQVVAAVDPGTGNSTGIAPEGPGGAAVNVTNPPPPPTTSEDAPEEITGSADETTTVAAASSATMISGLGALLVIMARAL